MTPEMDAHRWTQIRDIFDELVELDGPRRDERLAVLDASDPLLRAAVAELLAADAEAEQRLAHVGVAFARSARAYERLANDDDSDPLKLAGRTFSHFTIRNALASGGMGVLYLAEDTQLKRTVVLKFPLPSRRADGLTKERFLHEARSVGALEHPNVCSIFEAGETDDGYLFFAMPLYDGQTLQARIVADGALTQTDAVAIARQVTAGLGAAHRAGIVHRDVKPANVMLLADGSVKVLDFGLAKVHDVTFTEPQRRIGTVSYMSPEQIEARPIDGRSDVWAVGVILYEMLTGRRPFEGDYDVSIAHAIVHAQPRPMSDAANVAPSLANVVMRCLEKDPANRPASAAELLHALDTLDALPAHLPRRPPRSRGRMWAIALAIVATAAVGASIAHWRPHERSPEFVIVADFATEPADSSIADMLTDATRRVLSASRSIGAVPANRVRDARHRLRIPDSARLIDSVARQVALGDGIRSVVTGSLKRMGERYALSMRLISAVSGDVLASDEQTGIAGDKLIPVLDTMSQRLRVRAGDDLKVVRSEPSLLALTSSSLDAMRAYAAGLRAPRGKEEAFFRQAVALDTSFAIALWQLARTMENATTAARLEERRSLLAKAYAYRGSLTEYERVRVENAYLYSPDGLTPDRGRLIARLRQIVDRYPNVNDAVILGNFYTSRRQFAAAESTFRRAIALDSTQAAPYVGTITALLGAERIPEAKMVNATLEQHFPTLNVFDALLWYAEGRRDKVREVFEGATHGPVVTGFSYRNRSTLNLLEGRLAEWERDVRTADSLDYVERHVSALPVPVLLANYWVRTRPAESLRIIDSVIAANPTTRDMDVAELYAVFGSADKALAMASAVDSARPDGVQQGGRGHIVKGWVLLGNGKPREAIEEFRRSQTLPDGPAMTNDTYVDAQVALAFERAGLPDSAIVVYEHYMKRSQATGRLEDNALKLVWVIEHVAPLYEAKARRGEARAAWKRLVDLWQNADEELQPRVAHAKERIAALAR